tara:strand:- start:719 stop:1216 length:498 start_codon:yes stop_codon:yes gene_type:complete
MKQVKTAKGKVLNMQAMYDANQTTQAVGNANMNARGDVLGPGGKVVIPKNKVTSAYYATNPNAVKEVSIKQDPEEAAREAMKEEAKEIEKKNRAIRQKHEKQKADELAQEAQVSKPVELDPVVKNQKDADASAEIINDVVREREDGTKYREVEYADGSMEELPLE